VCTPESCSAAKQCAFTGRVPVDPPQSGEPSADEELRRARASPSPNRLDLGARAPDADDTRAHPTQSDRLTADEDPQEALPIMRVPCQA
jgi:hypothetical protein